MRMRDDGSGFVCTGLERTARRPAVDGRMHQPSSGRVFARRIDCASSEERAPRIAADDRAPLARDQSTRPAGSE